MRYAGIFFFFNLSSRYHFQDSGLAIYNRREGSVSFHQSRNVLGNAGEIQSGSYFAYIVPMTVHTLILI